MALTVRDAAEKVGKSRATVHRAIASGLISATRQADGSYLIDESELFRVFAAAPERRAGEKDLEHHETAVLRRENALLRERLVDKDSMLAHKDQVITGLQHRLDREADERRQAQERLINLITDQRSRRRRWWPW